MTKALSLLTLPLLFGCATTAVPSAGETYRALGTEPFWSVTIGNGRIAYDSANGPRFSVPAPPAQATINGHRYDTDRIRVAIRHGECSDGMSDRRYEDIVTVVVDGETLNGCGGAHTGGE